MRCRWCNDILELGYPTREQLKDEAECPYQKIWKPYQILAEIKGREYADAYKRIIGEYIKENHLDDPETKNS